MSKSKTTAQSYRDVDLPGLGRMQVPAHLSDAEVLKEVLGKDAEATPAKKTKKKS